MLDIFRSLFFFFLSFRGGGLGYGGVHASILGKLVWHVSVSRLLVTALLWPHFDSGFFLVLDLGVRMKKLAGGWRKTVISSFYFMLILDIYARNAVYMSRFDTYI